MKDIYKGIYAIYNGPAGTDDEQKLFKELAKQKILTEGNMYKVEDIDVGASSTYVKLKNIDASLNSIAMDIVRLERITCTGECVVKAYDIFADPRINPYCSTIEQ